MGHECLQVEKVLFPSWATGLYFYLLFLPFVVKSSLGAVMRHFT